MQPTNPSPVPSTAASEWLTPAQAAAELGVTTQTLRNWAAAGRLVPQRIGTASHRRYHASQVAALVAERDLARRTRAARRGAVDTAAV